jgi:T5SS/PEP-CTERM-associated repeat protein
VAVGTTGTGTLTIEDGGAVSNTFSEIGSGIDSSGTVTVTGPGSAWPLSGGVFPAGCLHVGNFGTATLNILDGGTVTNTDSYVGANPGASGDVTVSGSASHWNCTGSIIIGQDGAATLTIADDGTVTAGGGTGVTHVAQTSGGAALNIGAATEAAATAAGTLDAAEVRFGTGTGSLVFNHTDTAYTFAPVITGSGSLMVEAGTTSVSGDGLVVGRNGTGALGGNLILASGASLGGTGRLGAAGSTVTVRQEVCTLRAFPSASTRCLATTSTTAADRIVVAGTVDITGATLDFDLSPATADAWKTLNDPQTIVDKTSAGAVTGTFATVSNNLLFLDAALDYAGGNGNDITLALTRNDVSFATVARGKNQIATAQAIDALPPGSPVWRTVTATTGTLDLRGETGFTLGTAPARATGQLGWRHGFGHGVPASTQAFAGAQSFTLGGPPITCDRNVSTPMRHQPGRFKQPWPVSFQAG